MARPSRLSEYIAAGGLAVAAFAISPIGIELFTHRADLSFRVNAISMTFVAFLVAVIAALLARGRLRRVCFYLIAWIVPFVLLAGAEAFAISIHLADRIAPLEDPSVIARKSPWPGHLLSDARSYVDTDGLHLYRPWRGNGITLNKLGLRAALPTPKAPGDWHIAVTGGSAVWGWRVLDADTIPAQLQDILRREGHRNVTVYNFGIEGATLGVELALLKRFRKTYSIDQVLFYTGGNNAIDGYLNVTRKRDGPWLGNAVTFELVKVVVRLQAMNSEPSAETLHWLDTEALPALRKDDTLRHDIAAATQYCRSTGLRFDFALQPMLLQRRIETGPEAKMARTLRRIYPRFGKLTERMYRDALASGPAGHMHDLTHIFDHTSQPLFLDLVHINEAANRMAAMRVAPIVAARLP